MSDEKIHSVNAIRHLNMPGYEEQTTYMNDFAIAECFGTAAIRETFGRCIGQYKHLGVEYLAELCLVTNALCWKFHEEGNAPLSELYGELCQRCMDEAYTDGNLSKEQRGYFFRVTD